MTIYIIISITFLILLGLTMIRGRYVKAGIGETPLIYKSVVVEFFLNISLLLFLGLSLFLVFYNWKLLLALVVIGFFSGALVVVPIIERALFFITNKMMSESEKENGVSIQNTEDEQVDNGDAKRDEFVNALVEGLNKGSLESAERNERYDKIYAIEKTKWPRGLGSMLRSEVPDELQKELDECITRSQKIARDFCQTVDMTEAYLKENGKK